MSKPRLEGKIIIITGGASGIGAEAARLFAEHGARLVIVDIQDDLGQKVAVSIGEDRASYYHCDVRDEAQVENAVKFAVKKYGRIDVLFSNAGIVEPSASLLDLDLGQLDNVIATNFRGVAATIKHAARAMVEGGTRGSIICTTSVASEIAGAGPIGYTAAKHALLGLVRSACCDLGKHGIRVNGVAPFGVATPLLRKAWGKGQQLEVNEVEGTVMKMANLKGVTLKARHVAEAALFLASDESAYVSGHNLTVDGGYTAVRA